MTKGSIKRLARSLANRAGTTSVPDTSTSIFDADTAFEIAINQLFEKLDALPYEKEVDCVEDQAVYDYSDFEELNGAVLYRVDYVGFDSKDLTQKSLSYLDAYVKDWRYSDSGTPIIWVPYGERQIMTYPAPDSVLKIRAFGYAYPAADTYDNDNDVPPIAASAHSLIAVYMAMLFEFGLAASEDALRASSHWQTWENGIVVQRARIHPPETFRVGDADAYRYERDLIELQTDALP
jgi:hypothetical protein